MRGIHTPRYLYLYNAWSDGERKFATATTGTVTYRQMVKRAAQEDDIAARLHLFDHRVVEELFDVENDPDCLNNLVSDPKMQDTKSELRKQLAKSLGELKDPIAPLLVNFEDDALRNEYMAKEDARAAAARRNRVKRKRSP